MFYREAAVAESKEVEDVDAPKVVDEEEEAEVVENGKSDEAEAEVVEAENGSTEAEAEVTSTPAVEEVPEAKNGDGTYLLNILHSLQFDSIRWFQPNIAFAAKRKRPHR